MDRSLTVIIPTLNNINGLQYLLNYFKEKPYKVIVVDNSKKNLGFAGGVNKGAKEAKTGWLLILNDDIEFQSTKIQIPRNKQDPNSKFKNREDETIQELIKFAEERKLDAVSPILRNPNGKVENYGYKILPVGQVSLVKELTGSPTFAEALAGGRVNESDGLTAACLLVRTDMFKKLGGFDEKFFAYLEDVDFFLRFKKAGYKMGLAEVEVLHNHMTTSETMGNFKARQDMINWWRLYFKHPEKFRFNLGFMVERLRNVSGYIKASLKI